MSNFRTKLLGLAVLGASMAGVSYGAPAQLNCGGVQLANITAVLRAEGQTELVQDVTGTACVLPAGVTVTNGTFTLNLSATPETNDALLSITTDTEGGGTTYYLGTVSGTIITFSNIAFPAAPTNFDFHVYNVRVNASTAPLNAYITEGGTIQYTTASSVTGEAILQVYGGLPVGYTQTSLGVSIEPGFRNYFTCKGDPLSGNNLPGPSFTVDITEATPGAFKVQSATYLSGQAGENGSSLILGTVNASSPGGNVPVTGLANNPTQLTVTLGNIPAGATVYLPITINQWPSTQAENLLANVTTLTLEGVTAAPVVGNVAAFTPNAAGTITATYAVTLAWITQPLTFPVPVYVTFAANSTTAQGPFTASVAYAPGVAPLTGPPTTIPTFALGGKPLNASIIAFCQTTLLFPYVTNATGYETGLAIANTSTDNLNPKGTSYGPAVPGSCSVNFYGNAAQPKAVTYPPTGMLGVYTAATGQAPIYADTLTDLITISGFTGYAIANCNFLDAHGFAFIVDGSGGATGPEGYLALVIPRNTTTGVGADAGPTGEGDGN
jgi:hypothetical protein